MDTRLTKNKLVASHQSPVASSQLPVAHYSLKEINIPNRVNF